jgi:hypothetical protein
MQPATGPGTPGTPFAAIGTNANVVPGTQSSVVWSGLQPNKTYEWYAEVTDSSGAKWITSPRRFTTGNNSPPVVSNQLVTVTGDQPTEVILTASDSNGDALTFGTNSFPSDGLNVDFDPVAGTLTYLPSYGFRGIDRFTYFATDGFTNSSVATYNMIVVAPPDMNSNGIADAWEARYGITDPNGDDDHDGQSNLAEYLANTNPTNAASVLKITGATWQPNGSLRLEWNSIGGSRYRIQVSSDDGSGGISQNFTDLERPFEQEMDTSAYGSESTQSFIDFDAAANKARYYRIRVVR